MSPPGPHQHRLSRTRFENFLLQIRLTNNACNQGQAVSLFCCDLMFKAALGRPLGHAALQVDFPAADFPSLIGELDNDAHRSGADDAPFPIYYVRYLYNFAVNERGHRADADGVADAIDVPAERRFPVIDIL